MKPLKRQVDYIEATLASHEKHLEIANSEMGVIKVDLAEVKTNVNWLMRFFWVVSTSSVGGLITGVLNLIFK